MFDHCNTPEEVKAAYRRLVMVHHPDKGGDPSYFIQINHAMRNRMKELTGDTHSDSTDFLPPEITERLLAYSLQMIDMAIDSIRGKLKDELIRRMN